MIKYKGRSSMKQYMPNKPIKRGFKVWVRGDPRNGYVSQLDVYVGKKKISEENIITYILITISHLFH
jgi:hypothetical protein